MHPLEEKIEPDVPTVILNQAHSDLQVYIVNSLSVQGQRLDRLVSAALEIEAQTKRTNGRVSKHDEEIQRIDARLTEGGELIRRLKDSEEAAKKYRTRLIRASVAAFGFVAPLVYGIFAPVTSRIGKALVELLFR